MSGDPERGRVAIAEHDCGVCHVIPGVRGARGGTGPTLAGFAGRRYIAGVTPNEPRALALWVRDAPTIAPDTAMPTLPLGEREVQDVVAYLYTLR